LTTQEQSPQIYFQAAKVCHVMIGTLYRRVVSIPGPIVLKNGISFVKTVLKGEIDYKLTAGAKSYFDMVIPSALLSW